MRLLVLSDLHWEFHRDKGKSFAESYRDFDDYDVAVVAGDLCDFDTLTTAIPLLAANFKQVVYVCGNHECYGATINKTLRTIDKLCARELNVHWLEASMAIIDGQRFLGGTMWFPEQWDNVMSEERMTDFRLIQNFRNDVYKQNQCTTAWLDKHVSADDVVVTHHLPSPQSTPERFARSQLNRFFVCDQEALIHDEQPALWIHGHTHDSCNYRIGKTRVVANPFGYLPDDINPGYIERGVIEL